MLKGVREFLNTTAGKVVSSIVALLAIAVFVWMVKDTFAPSNVTDEDMFVDSATGKAYAQSLKAGMTVPSEAPSGGKTGYPAEKCFWTKDGKIKNEPTYVLLNSWLNKPGPTFCPDCGRLVVGHNPRAAEGMRPPPTAQEMGTAMGQMGQR